MTNNDEPLSPFEKFMIAYEYVTNYVYNEDGDMWHRTTSHWVPVLEGDKIVCVGYASLLQALCDRIFSPEEVKVFTQSLNIYDKRTLITPGFSPTLIANEFKISICVSDNLLTFQT
mgnify:CR=1 FL=1